MEAREDMECDWVGVGCLGGGVLQLPLPAGGETLRLG